MDNEFTYDYFKEDDVGLVRVNWRDRELGVYNDRNVADALPHCFDLYDALEASEYSPSTYITHELSGDFIHRTLYDPYDDNFMIGELGSVWIADLDLPEKEAISADYDIMDIDYDDFEDYPELDLSDLDKLADADGGIDAPEIELDMSDLVDDGPEL